MSKDNKTTSLVMDQSAKYVMPCYKRAPLVFKKGSGAKLFASNGERFIDFFSGWSVSSLGHCHPEIKKAISRQAAQLMHVPNNYYHAGQGLLAKEIIKKSFNGKVFFCNSGAESVEGAIKLARLVGEGRRAEIITMQKSFHGRTMGAMSATGQAKFHKGLKPLLKGFVNVPFNDISAVRKAINKKTIAVMLELIQGEGGVRVADQRYVKQLENLCRKKRILLIVDEVQTGMGRTGKMFCYQHYGIKPDIMMLAKSLGGGFPIGAIVAKPDISSLLQPGTHASTFGGNPLACAASLAVFKAMEKDKVLLNVKSQSKYLFEKLNALKKKYPVVQDVRGMGLMAAIELSIPATPVYEHCLRQGLLINVTQETVIRMAPPLLISKSQIRTSIKIIEKAIKQLEY